MKTVFIVIVKSYSSAKGPTCPAASESLWEGQCLEGTKMENVTYAQAATLGIMTYSEWPSLELVLWEWQRSGGTKMSLGHLYLPQWMRERLGHRQLHVCMCAESLQSCQTRCNPTDCSPPDSSVHGILQARILEWIAISSSRGSSWPRDQTRIFYVSCMGSWILYH